MISVVDGEADSTPTAEDGGAKVDRWFNRCGNARTPQLGAPAGISQHGDSGGRWQLCPWPAYCLCHFQLQVLCVCPISGESIQTDCRCEMTATVNCRVTSPGLMPPERFLEPARTSWHIRTS